MRVVGNAIARIEICRALPDPHLSPIAPKTIEPMGRMANPPAYSPNACVY